MQMKDVKSKAGAKISSILIIIFLSIVGLLQVFPFYFTIVGSLQPKGFIPEVTKMYFLPEKFSFVNYINAWKIANLGRGYINSMFYVTTFTVISGFLAMLVGYVLAKKRFRGRQFIFVMFLSTMMVPGEVLLIPNFIILRELDWLNSFAALIIPGIVNVMGIFIAKQFMESIPDVIIESAIIDGAGELRTFIGIVLPMAKSALSTYFILTFTGMWNEYLWPMIVLNDPAKFPVQLCVQLFTSSALGIDNYYNILKEASLILTLAPVLAVFFIFQKRFVDGIAISGLK